MTGRVAYVVSRGTYSDYRVLAVADSKKRAKKMADALNEDVSSYDRAEVETLPYFDRDPEKVTIYGLMAELMDNGSVRNERQADRVEWEHDTLYPEYAVPVHWRWVRAPMYHGKGGRLEVHGTDRERVRKVYSEKRAEILSGEPLRARNEAHS